MWTSSHKRQVQKVFSRAFVVILHYCGIVLQKWRIPLFECCFIFLKPPTKRFCPFFSPAPRALKIIKIQSVYKYFASSNHEAIDLYVFAQQNNGFEIQRSFSANCLETNANSIISSSNRDGSVNCTRTLKAEWNGRGGGDLSRRWCVKNTILSPLVLLKSKSYCTASKRVAFFQGREATTLWMAVGRSFRNLVVNHMAEKLKPMPTN